MCPVVSEAPEVFVSAEEQRVSVGERVSVSCNVSGHPHPELHWINKQNGRTVVGNPRTSQIQPPFVKPCGFNVSVVIRTPPRATSTFRRV